MNIDKLAARTDHLNGQANIAAINRAFRAADESHLYPINGAFNATERAIRRVRRLGFVTGGYEYCAVLESVISEIVNGAV
jgi:hypothetical protein